MSVTVHPALPGLSENYLFEEVAKQAAAFEAGHPLARVLSLGIGDVTQPICPVAVEALRTASAEMGTHLHRRGYGPTGGYEFLRQALAAEYQRGGYRILPEEITVTGGGKEALGAVLALFSPEVPVWVCDPGYPAYRDCAETAGHPVFSLPCRAQDGFLPRVEDVTAPGLIFLCSPNNPTGAVLGAEDWTKWIAFARSNGSLLLADTAYSAFIAGDGFPRSVYELPLAEECAIEIGSFSKSAGFTGLRCGWVVLPQGLRCGGVLLAPLWQRWLSCHSNGISYPVQRAAEAMLSPTGRRQGEQAIAVYRRNMARLRQHFEAAKVPCWGGMHAPYLWVQCPEGTDSWGMFRRLLTQCGVLCAPGAGFGTEGEGYLRFTAFSSEAVTAEALRREAVL